MWAHYGRDERRLRRKRHMEHQSEPRQHVADPFGLGMLGAQVQESCATCGPLRRMPGLSLVNEERDQPIPHHDAWIGKAPRQGRAIGSLPAPGSRGADVSASAQIALRKFLQIRPVRGLCDQPAG